MPSPQVRASGRLILAAAGVVGTLLPSAVLVFYIRNLLAGDPPSYLWVTVFAVPLVAGVVGSVLFGVYLWRDPDRRTSRHFTLALVGVGLAAAVAFGVAALAVIP